MLEMTMFIRSHSTAKSSHYDGAARNYDEFNEHRSKTMNQLVEKLLRKSRVKTVLDITCGTGSQTFWLKKRGFEVIGSDINSKMLRIARQKAKKEKLGLKFLKCDMRTLRVGEFDAVISIFNAVGHLTKRDFEKTMKNIHRNLNINGVYVFDIFNLSYFLKGNNITKLTIDWQESKGNKKVRDVQFSTIDGNGVLGSYTTSFIQDKSGKLKNLGTSGQTLQIYRSNELKRMLEKTGFKVLGQYDLDGSKLNIEKSERIITVARKI
jgi:ubiquinone/menaquinone biosynthesis C-methylase UbiE